jgi:hypothetical protein
MYKESYCVPYNIITRTELGDEDNNLIMLWRQN